MLFEHISECTTVWKRMCQLMPGICRHEDSMISSSTSSQNTDTSAITPMNTDSTTSTPIKASRYHRFLHLLFPLPTSTPTTPTPTLSQHLHRAGHRLWRLPIMLDLVGDRGRSRALSCCIFLAIFCFAVYFGKRCI